MFLDSSLLANRGYGETEKPPNKSDYTIDKLKEDVKELVWMEGLFDLPSSSSNSSSSFPSFFHYYLILNFLTFLLQVPALGYEKCTVVGHDWGGIIAW